MSKLLNQLRLTLFKISPFMLLMCYLFYALPVSAGGTKAHSKAHSKPETTTIYKYIDGDGVLHLTNKPPKKTEEVLYARSYVIQSYTPPPSSSSLPSFKIIRPGESLPVVKSTPSLSKRASARANEYAALIEMTATRYGIPSALLHAVIRVESSYNPTATSPKGAVGLMQLMPGTAKRYGVTDRTDPADNLNGGARYLSDLLKMFNQDVSLALAGYNAGENAVIRYGNTIPPYRETKNYVAQIMAIYRRHLLNAANVNYYQLAEK